MDNTIIKYIKENFSKPYALFAGFLILLLVFAKLDSFMEKQLPNQNIRLGVYSIAFVFWIIFWLRERNKWPKTEKGRLGLVICIKTENNKQKVRIKSDLVTRLKELIKINGLEDQLDIILITPQKTDKFQKIIINYIKKRTYYYSRGLNYPNDKEIKKWRRTLSKIEGHFFIWGSVKERMNNENRYYFDLDSLVTHQPLTSVRNAIIKSEFINIWAKKISFKEQFEFDGFQLSAELIYIAVKYIAGIAAFFSGDPFLAVKLHHNLENDLNKFNPTPPNIEAVKRKLKLLLCEEYLSIARWNEMNKDFIEANNYLQKAVKVDPNSYRVNLLKSIYQFNEGKPKEALISIKKAKNVAKNDGTWRYNEAFIYMYLERWEESIKTYKKISEVRFTNEDLSVNEVLEFNKSYYKSYPNFLQSLFIIAFIKLKKENNLPEAFEFFNKFIEQAREIKKYEFLLIRAKSYLEEVKERMNLK